MPLCEPCAPSNDQTVSLKRRNCIDNLESQRSYLIQRLSRLESMLEKLKDPILAEIVDLYNEI